ncbi:flavin reductase family protein [Actinopolymorpha sp. NPDC004070]|uniref:flavin reductase family protein n=1 Tax=Actinopolymorpha sp. NPDC004070 TaxID=3154548 RepID=UPI0033A87E53
MTADHQPADQDRVGDRPDDRALAPVGEAEYRSTMARFATGVTVVTTCLDGVDHAMTASAFTSVSLSPPLVLVCVEKIARFHPAVLAAGTWAVSVLTFDAHEVASRLARRGRPLQGQLDGIPVHRGLTGAALLSAAAAWLECRTVAVHDGGDHSIVVGEVVGADAPADPAPALVYYAGGYHAVGARTDPELQV